VLPLATLWVGKLILDGVVNVVLRHNGALVGRVWRLVLVEVALTVVNDIAARANALTDSLLADRFSNYLNVRLMRHSAKLDLSLFESPDFQDKLERARRQATGRLTLLPSLLNAGQDGLSIVLLSSGLIAFSPWLVVLLLAAVLPLFWGETHFTSLAYSIFYRHTSERRQLDYLRFLGSSPQSVKEITMLALGDYLVGRYRDASTQIHEENASLAIRRARTSSLLNLLSTAGYYAAYAVVLLQALSAQISVGTFGFLAATFLRARMSIERIINHLADTTEEALLLADLVEFFEIEPVRHPPALPIPVPRPIRTGIEFRNVHFRYPGSSRDVLQGISFAIRPGEKVALVGQNGAGKTTIAKLLAGLYEPTSGEILLDGIDLSSHDPEHFRRELGVMFQDYMRFDATVRENIAFGDIETLSDHTRVESAAEKSRATRIVERFSSGYEQVLGRRFEGGVDLSVGEWQKLALARLYIRDAQLMILDEPSASLDADAESELFKDLMALMKGRMSLVISHRFSTIRLADRILVLRDGIIQEQGTHDELVALGGQYARLFGIQAKGYR
jgi:ATP-binding cassette subfamily B protein